VKKRGTLGGGSGGVTCWYKQIQLNGVGEGPHEISKEIISLSGNSRSKRTTEKGGTFVPLRRIRKTGAKLPGERLRTKKGIDKGQGSYSKSFSGKMQPIFAERWPQKALE